VAVKTYVFKVAFVSDMDFSTFCSHVISKNLIFLGLLITIKIT